MQSFQRLKKALTSLRRRWGVPQVSFYKKGEPTVNRMTGVKSSNDTVTNVTDVITFPIKQVTNTKGMEFKVPQGAYTTGSRMFILCTDEITDVTLEDYLSLDGRKYDILAYHHHEEMQYWEIVAAVTTGVKLCEIFCVTACDYAVTGESSESV